VTNDEACQVAAAVSRLEDPWAIAEVAEALQRTIPSFDWAHLIRYDGRTLAEELTVPTSTWTIEGDPYRELRLRLGLQIGGRRLQPLAEDDPGSLDSRSN